jgi:hypothetical protein
MPFSAVKFEFVLENNVSGKNANRFNATLTLSLIKNVPNKGNGILVDREVM